MRHTGVTMMLEHGINPRVIQFLAGWTSLRMLERYGHMRDSEVRRAVTENAAYLIEAATKTATPEKIRASGSEHGSIRKVCAVSRLFDGVPNGIRTRVLALKGPRPGPLDDGDVLEGTSHDTTKLTPADLAVPVLTVASDAVAQRTSSPGPRAVRHNGRGSEWRASW